jgi:hypothetical protein
MRQLFVLDACDIKAIGETRMSIMSKERYYQLAPDLTICRILNGNNKERESKVTELYNQRRSTRDIAKELRMSLRDII